MDSADRSSLVRAHASRQNFYIVQGKADNTTLKLGAWGACTRLRVRHAREALCELQFL